MAVEGSESTLSPPVAAAIPKTSTKSRPKGRSPIPAQIVAYGVVLLVCFISLFPLYWMVITSFRQDANIQAGVSLWPEGGVFHLSNYATAWTGLEWPFQIYLLNSFMLSLAVVVGTVLSCTIVAYGFARFRFPGRGPLFAIVIATTMIPYVVTLIPQYAEFINIFGWGSGGSFLIWSNFFQFFPQIVPASLRRLSGSFYCASSFAASPSTWTKRLR